MAQKSNVSRNAAAAANGGTTGAGTRVDGALGNTSVPGGLHSASGSRLDGLNDAILGVLRLLL